MPARIFIGAEFFRELRENNCYYIDKTGLIEELLSENPAKVSLFTRPRRFGKTLMMTMLRDFFDIRQDSKALFEGLAISQNNALCEKWMNQYPTVFLTLKGVEGLSFEQAMGQMKNLLSRLCIEFSFLLESSSVDSTDRQTLSELKNLAGTPDQLANALTTLCSALQAHYGKPAILLIDEYDVPLARAEQNGYYNEMVSFLRNFLGAAFKTNPSLQLGILTGCLCIARESIFTGLNNFKCCGISDSKFSDKFGFTAQEVDTLLADTHFSHKKDVMCEWYDGYRFGREQDIYCPWDILQYVDDLQTDPLALPKAYWSNTSGNSVIRSFIGRTDLGTNSKFEKLLAGESIEVDLVESLTYDTVYSSEENLWSMLYLTGYLTKARDESSDDRVRLVIPNKEIREIFTKSISQWFKDTVAKSDRTELFTLFWNADAAGMTKLLRKELYKTISYYDAHEDFYHAFLAGSLSFSGYEVQSNRESGLGRPDILVFDIQNERAAIIEIKHASSLPQLYAEAQNALEQIEREKYAEGIPSIFESVIKYGIAFYKKECLVLADTLS